MYFQQAIMWEFLEELLLIKAEEPEAFPENEKKRAKSLDKLEGIRDRNYRLMLAEAPRKIHEEIQWRISNETRAEEKRLER